MLFRGLLCIALQLSFLRHPPQVPIGFEANSLSYMSTNLSKASAKTAVLHDWLHAQLNLIVGSDALRPDRALLEAAAAALVKQARPLWRFCPAPLSAGFARACGFVLLRPLCMSALGCPPTNFGLPRPAATHSFLFQAQYLEHLAMAVADGQPSVSLVGASGSSTKRGR